MLGLGLLVMSVAIAAVAVLDHREKQKRINHAELSDWYCTHQGTQCGGASPARIESRWNERQVMYEWGTGLLASASLLCLIARAGHRRRPGVAL